MVLKRALKMVLKRSEVRVEVIVKSMLKNRDFECNSEKIVDE